MPIAIVFVTDGDWGSGTGAPLPAATIDGNFWAIKQFLDDWEANPPLPLSVASVVGDGTQATFYLSDATPIGTVTLPQAKFQAPSVQTLEFDTDGTYELVAADESKYKRAATGGTVIVGADIGMNPSAQIIFRQVGAGVIEFEWPTDVMVNVPAGFLPQTGGQGCTASLKLVAENEWDLDGVLAADS